MSTPLLFCQPTSKLSFQIMFLMPISWACLRKKSLMTRKSERCFSVNVKLCLHAAFAYASATKFASILTLCQWQWFRPILCMCICITIDSIQNLTQILTQTHTQTLCVNRALLQLFRPKVWKTVLPNRSTTFTLLFSEMDKLEVQSILAVLSRSRASKGW